MMPVWSEFVNATEEKRGLLEGIVVAVDVPKGPMVGVGRIASAIMESAPPVRKDPHELLSTSSLHDP